MSLFNVKISLKFIIFCYLIISDKKLYSYHFNVHPFYLPNKKPILSINKNKIKILIKGRKYLDKCLMFSFRKKFKYIKKPITSVIIPLYNCEKTIKPALHSIQFQNMPKIEIILVNDLSTDNTLKIIKLYQEKDHRIKIINNHKNMGVLYSRSVAVLISKGKYIFSLDNDDMYFSHDVFYNILKIGIGENLDIIGFLSINLWNYTAKVNKMKNLYTFQYPKNYFLEQPELGLWLIKFKGKFLVHNNMIWDKCIKSSIYKNAINLIGNQKIRKFLSWAEDTSINFVIFNLAQTFKYIHKYGILHYKSNYTSSMTQPIETKLFGEIFFLDIIYDFSKNDKENKNLIVGQAFYIYNRFYNNITKFNNDSNSYYLKYVLNKIINCIYISKLNKRKIIKIFKSFIC